MRIEPLIEEEALRARVKELAVGLRRELGDARPVVLCVSEATQRFARGLERHWRTTGFESERVEVGAHRSGSEQDGPIAISGIDPDSLEGREVLVLMVRAEPDAVRAVLELVALGEPRSCRVCALLAPSGVDVIDEVGFRIEESMVLGYGIDVDGEYAELDWIGALRDDRF